MAERLAGDGATAEELAAIKKLQLAVKNWPQSLTLASMAGTLVVVHSDDYAFSDGSGPERSQGVIDYIDGVFWNYVLLGILPGRERVDDGPYDDGPPASTPTHGRFPPTSVRRSGCGNTTNRWPQRRRPNVASELAGYAPTLICPPCAGTGRVRWPDNIVMPCVTCRGTGRVESDTSNNARPDTPASDTVWPEGAS